MTRKNYDGWCLWHPKKGVILPGYLSKTPSGIKQRHIHYEYLKSEGYKIVKVKLQKVEG